MRSLIEEMKKNMYQVSEVACLRPASAGVGTARMPRPSRKIQPRTFNAVFHQQPALFFRA